jgi:hypothetical protein
MRTAVRLRRVQMHTAVVHACTLGILLLLLLLLLQLLLLLLVLLLPLLCKALLQVLALALQYCAGRSNVLPSSSAG